MPFYKHDCQRVNPINAFAFCYKVVKRDPIAGLGDLPKEHCDFGKPKTSHQNKKSNVNHLNLCIIMRIHARKDCMAA